MRFASIKENQHGYDVVEAPPNFHVGSSDCFYFHPPFLFDSVSIAHLVFSGKIVPYRSSAQKPYRAEVFYFCQVRLLITYNAF
jgi:hypothetical protein